MAKQDITIRNLGTWDSYVNKTAQEAIPKIYRRATEHSKDVRSWYWNSIKSKRISSWGIRMISFGLMILGVVLPLLAAITTDNQNTLICTQLGIVALAVAGLMQAADKIFGWSSGWLRYMTTVTAMEAATQQFELDWANHFLVKTGPIDDSDKAPLFQLAKRLEDELSKRQSDETDKWCAEFNSGLAMLNDLIKSQRDSAEKSVEAMQKAQKVGSIEMTLVHKAAPDLVKISLDGGSEEDFTGTVWSRLRVEPGQHEVKVTTAATPPQTVQKIAEVLPGGVARIQVEVV